MGIIFIVLLIFVAYIGAILANYGIPPSVSETFYFLPKGKKWLFTAFCLGVCFIIAPWLNATPEKWQFFAFLSVVGLVFVAGAAAYKQEMTKTVHFIGVGLCAVTSQLWIFIVAGLWWVSLICLLIAGVACFALWRRASRKSGTSEFANAMFWVEIWAFVSLFISLIIYIA